MRSVRSADPVAIKWPVGFQAIVRMLKDHLVRRCRMRCSYFTYGILDRVKKDHDRFLS